MERYTLREQFRERTWQLFCSKDYEPKMSTDRFLTIILHKAKKTYLRYVSLYCNINWIVTDTLEVKLLETEIRMFKLFDSIALVVQEFRKEMRDTYLKDKYQNFLDLVENFSLGVVEDREYAFQMVFNPIKQRFAA